MKVKVALLLVGLLILDITTSVIVFKFLSKNNVDFVNEPREENELHGFFKINNQDYFQVDTTAQVDIGSGLHYHKIDIRGDK